MAWLWDSWEEYVDVVHPVAVESPHRVRLSQEDSWFKAEHSLYKTAGKLEKNLRALGQLGFGGCNAAAPAHDQVLVEQAYPLVMEAVYAGEELLLYHRRLAKSKAAYGFLHQHSLPDHWNRYAKTHRIIIEINQFVSDVDELISGFEAMVEAAPL